jgi:septal ring factor EnvC (AmiA/AmiB activator)
MEAVNSFVMSWWPVIACVLAAIIWAAQSWVHAQLKESTSQIAVMASQVTLLISRIESQDHRIDTQNDRINQLTDALHAFQMEARKNFVTEKDIDRLTASVDGLKTDLSAWLTRIEAQIERK